MTEEVDHIDECPGCGTQFVGMPPDEFRDDHAPDCDPLLGLVVFTA